MRRSTDELNKMRKAGRVVAEMHEATRAAIRPGVTTRQLNEVAAEVLAKRVTSCISATTRPALRILFNSSLERLTPDPARAPRP